MNAEPIQAKPSRKRRGDHIALAVLFAFFVFSAFAMNPEGWGVFDWMAIAALSLLSLWSVLRACL